MKNVALNDGINTYQIYDNDVDAFLGSNLLKFFNMSYFLFVNIYAYHLMN